MRLTRRIERQDAEILMHGALTGEQTWENRCTGSDDS
jgi:hypothetical protein